MASPSPSVSASQPKGSTGSPTKMASSVPRPLSELSPTEMRRNSPSFHQQTHKKTTSATTTTLESSPFQSSPFNASVEGNSSPRLFWQGRENTTPSKRLNTENMFPRDSSPSPTRRSSIEKLQKASRVKNSNMFAREMKLEYDPTSVPLIERPLAKQVQGNAYGGSGLDGLRSAERTRVLGHHRNNSTTSFALYSPTHTPKQSPTKPEYGSLRLPSKDQTSPTKSSLSSRFKSSLDSQASDDTEKQLPPGRFLHRHAKSVTFDAAPPQINEYEMATPDLSSIGTGSRENSYDTIEDEEDFGYDQNVSFDQDDSFDASLEDTAKTPVMGPDDWRHDSPSEDGSIQDGPEGSPMPDAAPSSVVRQAARTDSLNSTGSHRPLPPLPPAAATTSEGHEADVAPRVSSSQRTLPTPPTKDDAMVADFRNSSMTLEERLKLMMIHDDDAARSVAEQQRERRMRRAVVRNGSQTPDRDAPIAIHEDPEENDELPSLEYELPTRISRESILRKIHSSTVESDYNYSPAPSSSPERALPADPDVPIPSTEVADEHVEAETSVIIKAEPEDEPSELYDIPDLYQRSESRTEEFHDAEDRDGDELDSESQYSETQHQAELQIPNLRATPPPPEQNLETATPRASVALEPAEDPVKKDRALELPSFSGFNLNTDFSHGLQTYMTPSPPAEQLVREHAAQQDEERPITSEGISNGGEAGTDANACKISRMVSMSEARDYLRRPQTPPQKTMPPMPDYDGAGWGSDEDERDPDEVGTPESVIHHSQPSPPPQITRESPTVPEREATIKASGSKLKTRPSATPADLAAMREIRRQVSGEAPNVPPIPQRHRNRPSLNLSDLQISEAEALEIERQNSFKKKSLTLDIGNDLGLGLDQDFDRVIQAQKRGYLMRQNTKVVVASSQGDDGRGSRSCGNSPVKRERPDTWTVEPWNGQHRKSSVRDRSPRRKPVDGTVPPLPGHKSNATGLGALVEDPPLERASEDAGERGRLFVKVLGVKDLDLPLPTNEQTWFSLTLDNGVHCVTTAWLELGRNAPVGQEFELVVPQELEFQLTLNAKLEKPAPIKAPISPVKSKSSKPSTFSRVFASPKKRKELELRQREEDERLAQQKQQEATARRLAQQPTAWDLLSPLAAEDGSFGRSYVCLKDHEARCYGRPYTVDVACFNEWAVEEISHAASVMSKRTSHVQRRAPYKVAKLEIQLLFVPKPRNAKDEDMPKSLNSCIREMKEAELAMARSWEGHLSQQGGDCPYWRRRFFRLAGNKLTAYHESTRQPRATINLANACKLIDDKSALTQKETGGKGGKRRKSGFAEEEEGYMFVEEGFRIRFNNGEVIDFYADTRADKDGWMRVLEASIGRDGGDGAAAAAAKRAWCELVLKREHSQMRKGSAGKARQHQRTQSSFA